MKKLRIVIVVTGALLLAADARAATIKASTCSWSDVNAAITSAAHGDVVQVPAGSCTWTSQLNISKGITLQGAGQGVTTLTDNVAKPANLMRFNVNAPNNFRLTAMSIVGQASDPNVFNQGHIYITGTSKAFRIDHLTITNMRTSAIRAEGDLWGVIDHVTASGSNKPFLQASHDNWGGSNYGDGSWAEQLYWGTARAIYVEDCTLTANGNPFVTNFFDSLSGARLVIRNNTITQGNVTSHGADSGQRERSVRSMEIYNNTFTFPANMPADFIVWNRGGTSNVFNNTVIADAGVNSMVKATNCRDNGAGCGGPSFAPWGACNGSSVYDQNAAGQSGYRCVDQPGSGTSNHLNGQSTPPQQWVGNSSDPFYLWGNTLDGAPTNTVATTTHVQSGRDFFNNGTQRPGYTPYVYPHPLVTGTLPPSAPTNLRITD